MILSAICTKCEKCIEIRPSETADDGRMIRPLSVDCELGGLLILDSDLPKGCIYEMEQVMCEDDAMEEAECLVFAEVMNEADDVSF